VSRHCDDLDAVLEFDDWAGGPIKRAAALAATAIGVREELAAGMTKRPDPLCHRRAGACHLHRVRGGYGADDQLTNAALAAWFGACRCTRAKESPGRAGAR
jgi:hypothetical protein